MNEQQRIRIEFWIKQFDDYTQRNDIKLSCEKADESLAELDKRFFPEFTENITEEKLDGDQNDGWIDHDGKEQPVPGDILVFAEYRDGWKSNKHIAQIFDWKWSERGDSDDDIVKYKVAK